VEGENGSYDVALFQAIYPTHTVIPRGSCSQVKLATKALHQATQFHHLHARGIVDRDRMNSEEIRCLRNEDIEVLNVAEIENLFCIPEVLELIAKHQKFPVEAKLAEAKEFVFKELKKELDEQISKHVANEIKFRLNVFDIKQKGAKALKQELELRTNSIDVDNIYNQVQNQFNNVIQQQDYIGALGLFNRKGLARQLSGNFEIKNLPAYVLRMIQSDNSKEWIQAFSSYVPKFDS
jgi:hypothetical protein